MGSLHEFRRKQPMLRPAAQPNFDTSAEDTTSVRILLWTFAISAIAMCVTVVACFTRSWNDLFWISGFVLIFALAKIGLANWLFVLMMRCDRDSPPAPEPASPPRRMRLPRPAKTHRRATAGKLSVLKPVSRPRAS